MKPIIMQKIACPQCDKVLRYREEQAGKMARCPHCDSRFRLAVDASDDEKRNPEPKRMEKKAKRAPEPREGRPKAAKKKARKPSKGDANWIAAAMSATAVLLVLSLAGFGAWYAWSNGWL